MRAVTEFKYLGRVLTNTDDDCPAVAGNIRKSWANWGRLTGILGREGADPKVSRSFYTAVTQQVILFGAELWVLTKDMESALEGVQGRFIIFGKDSRLCPKEEDLLCHGSIKTA